MNSMELPTSASEEVALSALGSLEPNAESAWALRELLAQQVVSVSQWTKSYSKLKTHMFESTMPSAVAHHVQLLAHTYVGSWKVTTECNTLSALLQKVHINTSEFDSVAIIVKPAAGERGAKRGTATTIVGHALDLAAPEVLPAGTVAYFFDHGGDALDLPIKEIKSISNGVAHVRFEGDVKDSDVPASFALPSGLYSQRGRGKDQRHPPSTTPSTPFPQALRHPGAYNVDTLAALTYDDVRKQAHDAGFPQFGVKKGMVNVVKFERRSRAKSAKYFTCPVITFEAPFPLAVAMTRVNAFFEARMAVNTTASAWCSNQQAPRHMFEMWMALRRLHPELPKPIGGYRRIVRGGCQIELGLHAAVPSPANIYGIFICRICM